MNQFKSEAINTNILPKTRVYIDTYMCVCASVMYVCVSVSEYVCVYMYVGVYVCEYICMLRYIYIYIYIY